MIKCKHKFDLVKLNAEFKDEEVTVVAVLKCKNCHKKFISAAYLSDDNMTELPEE